MATRGRRIVWNNTMINILTSGVRKNETVTSLAKKLGVSGTTVASKIKSLRGITNSKPEKIKVNQPAKTTLTGNVTLVHKNFTMTSKGNNLTITINQ